MQGILAFLGRKPLKAWEKDSLKAWWKGHSAHIHDHHSNEDELFMGQLKVYQNEMQKHVTCLMTGWAPKPSSCCC